MFKMASQMETIINAYRTLAKIPAVVSARVNRAGTKVTSKWTVRNLDKGKPTKYNYNYLLDKDFNVIDKSDFGTDVTNELLSAVSPSENLKAIIREEKDSKDAKKQYLEVWSGARLQQSVDLTALDVHGDVYADAEFGSLNWSPDENSLVYIAEKKVPKSEPYIKRKPAKDAAKTEDGSGEAAIKKGEEFLYRQDWGEQLVGKVQSVAVVFRLDDETVTVLEGLPESWCPAQVRFSSDGASIVGLAFETEPRRLGLMFCTNRHSSVFQLTLDGKMSSLSPLKVGVRSPRVASNKVFWLQREADGPHHSAVALMCKDGEAETRTIIPTEISSVLPEGREFYGVYSPALPARCASLDGTRLVFSTPQRCDTRAYVVDVDGGRIVDISNRSFQCSTTILDVCNDVIVAVCSNMTTPGQLYIARLPPAGLESTIQYKRVSEPLSPPDVVAAGTVDYLELEHKDVSDSVKTFSAIYFSPPVADNKKLPLIVWPHGGPHSSFINSYSIEAALFAMLGLASVRINYRGSTGFTDANVRSLIAHIGDYDFRDCCLTLTTLLERNARLDSDSVVLYGGSYGGYIAGHLAARTDYFKAMVLRNPLIDLATKGLYADNSDGCAVEAGYEFTEAGPVSEDQLIAMRRCSPLAHVHKVKAPTCLMLGSGDKRVPFFQGLEYARRLKANGVVTRVYMYDDNHSLSSPASEMDNLINGAAWFTEHLNMQY